MNKILTILGLSIFTLFSCSTQYNLKPDEVVMYIAADQVDCVGVVPMKCMKVKENKSAEWLYFYDPIIGFDYEKGYEYELIVQKKKKEKPIPMDVSSIEYTLIKEVKKAKK